MSLSQRRYVERYMEIGLTPIPLPPKQKGPRIPNWPQISVTDNHAENYFPTGDENIGILLGKPSNGLTDVDLDCDEVRALAADFLPQTSGKFGRNTVGVSHWIYLVDTSEANDCAAHQFRDPVGNEMLVELRLGAGNKAAQTMFPGSVHPNGERIRWQKGFNWSLSRVQLPALEKAVRKLASAALLRRHWPTKGSRHEAQLALANWLTRAGDWSENEVSHFLSCVAGEPSKRTLTARDAVSRKEMGDTGFGYPTLIDHLGDQVMSRVSEWLDIRSASLATNKPQMSSSGDTWPLPDMSLLSPPETVPPRFPIELFGPWSDWIAKAAEAKGAPPDYIAATLVTAVSSFVGNTRLISPWMDWKEPPILWMAIVGNPSAGKSPAMDAVLDALDRLEKQDMPAFEKEMDDFRKKKVIAAVANKAWAKMTEDAVKNEKPMPPMPEEAKDPLMPVPPRYRVADATTEKLVEISSIQNRGVLMVRDELAGWLAGLDRYQNAGGREFFLEAFGGRRFRSERVKHETPQVVDRLSISILGSIQPDKLFSRFLSTVDDGLVARFFYVWPNPVPINRPIEVIDQNHLMRALRKVLDLDFGADVTGEPAPIQISLTEEALEELQDIRKLCSSIEETSQGTLKSLVGKFPGGVLRMACALLHMDWAVTEDEPPTEIDLSLMKRARAYMFEYLLPMARRCFGDAATAPEVRASTGLARWIHDDGRTEFTAREVQRSKLFGLQTAEKVRSALDVLTDAGWVKYIPEQTGGRPRQLYRVNPAVFDA